MDSPKSGRGEESLSALALSDPHRLFNQAELAVILHLSPKQITEIKKAGAPFFGSHSRPEWVLDWLKEATAAAPKPPMT